MTNFETGRLSSPIGTNWLESDQFYAHGCRFHKAAASRIEVNFKPSKLVIGEGVERLLIGSSFDTIYCADLSNPKNANRHFLGNPADEAAFHSIYTIIW